MSDIHNRLVERVAQWAENHNSPVTAIPELTIFKQPEPTDTISFMHTPSVCLIVQGRKRVMLGEDAFIYDPQNYLITSVHLPTVVQVLEASPEKPYLGLTLEIDTRDVSQLMAEGNLPAPRPQHSVRGMATGRIGEQLLEAFGRLIELLDNEEDIPVLAPVIQREITYRLLVGDQGARLRQMAMAGTQSNQVARAIDWLRQNYAKPLRVDHLAETAGMSTSTFHHHFRSVTALSPLQYQKRLRLQEARRLMLTEEKDAGEAAFMVGYDSPSQFSREYSRQFGQPPLRDINQLRQQSMTATA